MRLFTVTLILAGSNVMLASARASNLAARVDELSAPIVSTEALRDALASSEGVSLVDVRDAFEYQAGHVKGAANAASPEFLATVNGLPGMIPSADTLTALGRRLGIRRDRPTVVYGNAAEPFAARAAVIFRLCGHPRTHWLDGGIEAARKAGLPITTASEEVPPGDFTATPPAAGIVDGRWILSHLRDPSVVVVDTRTEREFDRGHIPGARRVDWKDNFDGGRLRPEAGLWTVYAPCSLAPKELASKTVVCYCAIGTRASVNLLALQQLGFEHVLLYPGSWADWSHGDFPIEKKSTDKN